MPSLYPRYYDECGYDRYGNYVCRNSVWSDWVRWVVLVVCVLFFFGLFIVCSCLTARRRRRAGRQPFYGTGWAARPGANNHNNNTTTAQPYYNNQYAAPAPPYSAQPQQNSYHSANQGSNQGYYGQQNGVELQQPQPAYTHGGDNVYQPPTGPPPGKV